MGCRSLNDKAESKRNIPDGFINGFSVQSPYLLSATVLSLRRLPRTNSSALPGAAGSETCAGAQPPRPPCWSKKGSPAVGWLHKPSPAQRHQPSPYFQSLKQVFTIFMSIQKMAPSSAVAAIFSLYPFCPRSSSAPSARSSVRPSVTPTPGIPSSPLLTARDSCHLGPIRSDWSSILQRQAHLICKALQLGL